ncbi:MAG: transporter substrate-binding domain-containing protein [Prevotella sp.]|nr:transporter substrate-binding domain-containing protein [Prevotella sp.]
MKYRYLLSLLLLTATLRLSALESLKEKYNEQRPVVVVCDWDRPPYEYIGNDGKVAGSNIDVLKALMEDIDIPVHFVMKDWGAALSTFTRGEADIILADIRRFSDEDYAISRNIINYNHICIATYQDSVKDISLEQLNHRRTVLKAGEYSVNYFHTDSLSRPNVEYQTAKVALLGLISGDYKYFIWGEQQLKWKIKELNLDGIVINESSLPISEVHIIGHDSVLVEVLDDNYSRLKQSGELSDLKDKWLHPGRAVKQYAPIALSILLVALLVAIVLYLLSRVAKTHVRRTTKDISMLNTMMVKALHMGNYDVMVYDIAHDRVENRYGHILPSKGMSLQEFIDRIHPDQRQEFIEKHKSLLRGRTKRFDLNKRWNQGTADDPQWLNFQGHAILETNAQGKPAYIINAVYDVTHEMEEHKAARELAYKYKTLSNAPLVAMSFYDNKGNFISSNDSMKSLIGFSDKTPQVKRFWIGQNLFDIETVRGTFTPQRREAMLYCHRFDYPDFHIDKYLESYIYPLFNDEGEIANYLVGSVNLTSEQSRDRQRHQLEHQRRQLEEKIREQHWLLRYALIRSKRLLLRTDPDAQTVTFFRSPGYREYTHSFSQLLDIVDEENRDSIVQMLETRQEHPQTLTIRLKPCAGCHHATVYRLTLHPVCNDDGQQTHHIGVIADISALSEAAHELEKTTQLAKDSLRMKSGFMASMTHELRTPLNAIVGFTGVLDALGDSPERSEYVHIIRSNSDMLQRLIHDIIEASSISDEDAIDIHPKEVDFGNLFEEICITLAQRIENPQVTFVKDNPHQSLVLILDIERVIQILTNFMTNAVKFTRQGHIKVGYRYTASELYLYCEDTGAGIPKEQQERVFERFVKLDEYVQGTGMGLAISKAIAERCGGNIGVISEGSGKGSTFWCKFPCQEVRA